ncbi:MAG: hypothetical protein M3P24_05245, partial [Gemmatimonadota bacterium]|nr:hypothetical protein [Gemmatimonadota bacterium]
MYSRPFPGAQSLRRSLAALGLLLCVGCVPRYGVNTERDDFRGLKAHQMRGNVLGDPDRGGESIELNAEVITERKHAPRYALRVRYRDAHSWLKIPAGESLVVLMDTTPVTLRGPGSRRSRSRHFGRGVQEEARYEVTADVLRRIAGATKVRLRIIGS